MVYVEMREDIDQKQMNVDHPYRGIPELYDRTDILIPTYIQVDSQCTKGEEQRKCASPTEKDEERRIITLIR